MTPVTCHCVVLVLPERQSVAREFEILHGGNSLLLDLALQITVYVGKKMRKQLVGHRYID